MAKKIYAGGAFSLEDGILDIDIPLLLKHLEVRDTPANRNWVTMACLDVAKRELPDVSVYLLGTS